MLPHTGLSSSTPKNKPGLFSTNAILTVLIAAVIYLSVSYLLIGFKTEQLILTLIFAALYFASHITRRFVIAFSIFIIYWIVFDYMKAFPNYRYNSVNIESLYNLEKQFFGIQHAGNTITANEYFALHPLSFIDVLAGIFYLCWVPVPLAFAGYLFFKNRQYYFQFALTFFLVNIIGFLGYYLYPAAPPWYVAQHGFDFVANTPGNTAGLSRFDDLLGVNIFNSIYAKSSNVFAAMPSLHAAYMLIVLFFGVKLKLKSWNLLFALILGGIWFAAVYSGHHYILDILAGIFCALAGITILQYWFASAHGKKTNQKLVNLVEK